MKCSEIAAIIPGNWEVPPKEDMEFETGYTSDLLSDVMANAPEDSVLITIQAHKNTVAVATLAGVSCIILCNNRNAAEDMKKAAQDEGIAIFLTVQNQFEVSGGIFSKLKA